MTEEPLGCLHHLHQGLRLQPGLKLDLMTRPVKHHALLTCLGYRGCAKPVSISVNHVVCHGTPSERALRGGDIAAADGGLSVPTLKASAASLRA